MSKILVPSQQFVLQQKIARKSISTYQPQIKAALQKDFDKAAELVKEYGVNQTINNINAFFDGNRINNILRNLYESVGGYTASRYQKIFDKYKKDDSIEFDNSLFDEWVAFMLSYWTSISGPKMYGIENTTDNEILRIMTNTILYGKQNNLSQDEVNKMVIKLLKEGKLNNARSLLIARTESHQAINVGAMGSALNVNIPLQKQWIHSEYLGNARNWHVQLENQTNPDVGGIKLGVNQPFMVNTPKYGIIEMQYAHDDNGGAVNNCNCRCSTVYTD